MSHITSRQSALAPAHGRARLRCSAAVLALAVAAGCSGPSSDDYPFPTGDQPIGKADSPIPLPVFMNTPTPGLFDQQIDHPADGSSSPLGSFKQRFWYSTQFAGSDESPVLFYFCGEAPCDPFYATTMADAAMALGASVVVLEHRYYGQSKPFVDETLDHMKYLTIHNALEDAASFERWARDNLPLKGKWLAVGGSYPGMLAAFYREKHPELVVGAWASSAPVNVQLSFSGYDAIASAALGDTCTLLFQQVLSRAGAAFDDPAQRDTLSTELFGVPAPATKADFMNWISSSAESAAQYGKQRRLCAALLQDQDDPLMGFNEYLHPPVVTVPDGDAGPGGGGPDGGVLGGDDAGPLEGADAGAAPGQPAPARGAIIPNLAPPTLGDFTGSEWFYQVCTEVGFYQIHNGDRTHSVMSDLITEKYWADQCDEFVGQQPAIDATRETYLAPLERGEVTNVLFVNGSLDPWSSLSFTDASAPQGLAAFVVQTGSHCEDLQNLNFDLVLGVFKAHKLFHDMARTWLSQ